MIEQKQHEWVKSTLGHGDTMCLKCSITNLEAAVLDRLNICGLLDNNACNCIDNSLHDKDRKE